MDYYNPHFLEGMYPRYINIHAYKPCFLTTKQQRTHFWTRKATCLHSSPFIASLMMYCQILLETKTLLSLMRCCRGYNCLKVRSYLFLRAEYQDSHIDRILRRYAGCVRHATRLIYPTNISPVFKPKIFIPVTPSDEKRRRKDEHNLSYNPCASSRTLHGS